MTNSAARPDTDAIDWTLTTWEGARREQLRRWSALTLEEVVRAQEEMQALADRLSQSGASSSAANEGAVASAASRAAHPLPAYSEELGRLSLGELSALLIANEDRVPRSVIDECARRGNAMIDHIGTLLRDDDFWGDDVSRGQWWLRLHAVMILGLVPGERAGGLLVAFMRRIGEVDDESLQDWLAGYWPALFRNKSDTVVPELRALCEDRAFDWYIRTAALDAAVSMAQLRGEEALADALAWCARMAADESEDWDMRLYAGNTLLDFPRAVYRPLLDDLAARQTWPDAFFMKDEVEQAYSAMEDTPQWERFRDPWEFYTPSAIETRQQRWEKEDSRENKEESEDEDLFPEEPMTPYMRETPKVGRNDPCPCGSGKKYKKCCLPAE